MLFVAIAYELKIQIDPGLTPINQLLNSLFNTIARSCSFGYEYYF